jgi:hypothetical protein
MVLRAALQARPRPATTLFLQRRQASTPISDSHGDEHHDSDNTQYANEGASMKSLNSFVSSFMLAAGFLTPFWRNTALFSVIVVGFYKFAPSPGEDVYITRYLAQFKTPRERWADINTKHAIYAAGASDGLLLQQSATRPYAHRYRYPQ